MKRNKQYKKAIHCYEKVRARCSLEISVYIDIAQCYHEIGNIPESKRILFLASKIDSSHEQVMSLLKQYEYEWLF